MARSPLLLSLLMLAACTKPPAPLKADRESEIERRKDAVVAQLADCESGPGGGPASAYVGRFQFEPGTVIAFVKERDGRTISRQQAVAIARDYGQAAALAKYIIFERDGASHWPACGRKIGLRQQVAEIKSAR